MNAVAHPLLPCDTLTGQAGFAAISATGSALETRPTMTWHIGSANGRPVIRWVMLPAQSSMVIDER